MNKTDVVILGAGPSGLAASFELHKVNRSFVIIEKNDRVGGLARTLQYGEFITDIGPHRFFSQNKYLYDFIEDLLGNNWIKVNRLTRFYINDKFFLYPVELKNAIINVGPYIASRIILDFLYERIKDIFVNKAPANFEEQIVSDYGRSLAELNMLNYTEKIWGLPCSEISPDWAKQRIKDLSIMEVIKKAIIKSNNGPKTLVDQFFYPETGTGLIYSKIVERILNGNGNEFLKNGNGNEFLKLNSRPTGIYHKDNRIVKIIAKNGNNEYTYYPENIISTIPITEFINLLKPRVPDRVLYAAKNLKFRSHISVFITLNKSSVFRDQWLYFPDKKIPFGRIMEPKNFSKRLSPPDKTSLLVEYFCWENDNIWKLNIEKLFELTIEWLEKLNFIKRGEVISHFIHREKYAYPVYGLNYKDYLQDIREYLNRFDNLQLVGRAGSFRYNNQDHALEMGILASRNIIEGKRKYNIDDIGSEQEYFERGYVINDK